MLGKKKNNTILFRKLPLNSLKVVPLPPIEPIQANKYGKSELNISVMSDHQEVNQMEGQPQHKPSSYDLFRKNISKKMENISIKMDKNIFMNGSVVQTENEDSDFETKIDNNLRLIRQQKKQKKKKNIFRNLPTTILQKQKKRDKNNILRKNPSDNTLISTHKQKLKFEKKNQINMKNNNEQQQKKIKNNSKNSLLNNFQRTNEHLNMNHFQKQEQQKRDKNNQEKNILLSRENLFDSIQNLLTNQQYRNQIIKKNRYLQKQLSQIKIRKIQNQLNAQENHINEKIKSQKKTKISKNNNTSNYKCIYKKIQPKSIENHESSFEHQLQYIDKLQNKSQQYIQSYLYHQKLIIGLKELQQCRGNKFK